MGTYCTVNNFMEALRTISEDISVVGFPPIVLYDKENPSPTIVSLVNTVWLLLHQRQRLIDSKLDLEQNISGLSADTNHLKEKLEKLKLDMHTAQNCLHKQKMGVLSMEQEKCSVLNESKLLKKEIQELKQQSKSQEWQFKHDFQRQQNEIALLQTKLRKLLRIEKGESCKKETGSSKQVHVDDYYVSSDVRSNEVILKKSVCRLESNIQTLVKENLELRKLLDSVSNDLSLLLKDKAMWEKRLEETR